MLISALSDIIKTWDIIYLTVYGLRLICRLKALWKPYPDSVFFISGYTVFRSAGSFSPYSLNGALLLAIASLVLTGYQPIKAISNVTVRNSRRTTLNDIRFTS